MRGLSMKESRLLADAIFRVHLQRLLAFHSGANSAVNMNLSSVMISHRWSRPLYYPSREYGAERSGNAEGAIIK